MNTSSISSSAIYSSYVERSRIDQQVEEANVYVAQALRYVIENVLAQLSATLVVTISTRDKGTARWFEYVMNKLVYSWRVAAVQLLRFSTDIERLRVRVPGRKRLNLLLVDSHEGLLNTNITEDNADFDDPEYYFIFLQTRDHLIPLELRLILDHCLAHYWLHCNVMIQTAEVDVLVYSYYPYTSEHCQAAQPVLVNHFDGQRMVNATMFPDKLTQLHGCPISVLTWHQPPFVELAWNDADGGLRASGFEIQLVEHLSRLLNFTMELINLTLVQPELYRLANGSSEGPMEWLLQRRANLSLGYFRKTARRNQLLTTGMSYYSAPLVAVLQRESYRFGSLALLTFPFEWSVWLMLLGCLALQMAIRGAALPALELLLGQTLTRLPRSWLPRLVLAHWLYAVIPLRICYQSLLFHLIRMQLFATLPSSLEQLLAENFHGLCTANTLRMLHEMPLVAGRTESFTGLATPYDQEVLDTLQHAQGGKIFAIASMDVALAYLRSSSQPDSYHVVGQPVNVEYAGLYMPKHSYLYEKLNEAIRRLDDTGFIHAWRRAAFVAHRRQQDVPLAQERRRYISNSKLSGVYKLLALLYTICGLVFAIELLLQRWTWTLRGN
ncbi:uncharacterized protein LOC117580878 [Drosophila guanche]|uniref:Putative ionotropic receptor ligand binding domain-containing protein n=1 Tax=Drosophila guanche TaxID=7266 RepID=A0A3B0JCL7_DROGU|nr:uncharacterized protein LOC117580878 [Drosophila guanche]SPP78323.1 Hypothetical predicted protein [Drosophila guanche]